MLRTYREMADLIAGLLDRQLVLIDSQLNPQEPGPASREGAVRALTELRDSCLLTKDLLSALNKRPLGWLRIKRAWAPTKDIKQKGR
jgi:hypothetical protein